MRWLNLVAISAFGILMTIFGVGIAFEGRARPIRRRFSTRNEYVLEGGDAMVYAAIFTILGLSFLIGAVYYWRHYLRPYVWGNQ